MVAFHHGKFGFYRAYKTDDKAMNISYVAERGKSHVRLLTNNGACWSTILPNLVVIGIIEWEIKPLTCVIWSNCDVIIITYKVRAGLPSIQVRLS